MSGTHALFMATMTCDTVHLYGLSYTGDQVYFRRGNMHDEFRKSSWVPYEHHGWEFDGYLLRLLHLAGRVSICTRDEPKLRLDKALTWAKYGDRAAAGPP